MGSDNNSFSASKAKACATPMKNRPMQKAMALSIGLFWVRAAILMFAGRFGQNPKIP
jgi:hypothetical protein